MKFFFCETCGKRLTDADLESGQARNKQVKGIYCKDCASSVMTMSFDAMSEAQARAHLKKESSVAVTPVAATPQRRESNSRIQPAVRRTQARDGPGGDRQGALWLIGGLAAAVCVVGVLLLLKKPTAEPPAETAAAKAPASTAPAVTRTATPPPASSVNEPAKAPTQPSSSAKTPDAKTEPSQPPEPAATIEEKITPPAEAKSETKSDPEEEDVDAKTPAPPPKPVDIKDLAKPDAPYRAPGQCEKARSASSETGPQALATCGCRRAAERD